MGNNTKAVNRYTIDSDFYQMLNDQFLAGYINVDEFWDHLTTILSQTAQTVVNVPPTNTNVSLLSPRYVLKALNARWGSLYSALYHEHAIPHSAGLRTGSKYNIARGDRVINYSKEFLDASFPLAEGSHKDAVGYMVYFQNMMVVLADGSTTGLKNPAHFAAKSGSKGDPDSIVLKHEDLQAEILFSRCGVTGSRDIANIEDIRIEAPARTLISCRAETTADKCQTYQNLLLLFRGELKATYNRDGKAHTRRLNRVQSYTAKDGSAYNTKRCNPLVLQLETDNCPAVMWDEQQRPVPTTVIDAMIASLAILHRPMDSSLDIALKAPDTASSHQIHQLLTELSNIPGMPANSIKLVNHDNDLSGNAKAFTQSADRVADQIPFIEVAEEALKNTETMATQNDAVLKATHHFG